MDEGGEKWSGGGNDTYQVLQLSPGLLYDAVLSAQDDAHATEVADLRPAHDERVDVEATSSKDPRDAREHTRLVLHEAVEDMPTRQPRPSALRITPNARKEDKEGSQRECR